MLEETMLQIFIMKITKFGLQRGAGAIEVIEMEESDRSAGNSACPRLDFTL